MKKLGLALGSGGARGIAHIGFLKALEEEGIKPDFITGSSMGAIVGGAYAAGASIDALKDEVWNLKPLNLVSLNGRRGGVSGTKKVREILLKHCGDITFAELKIPFHCFAVDMISQELIEFDSGSLIDAMIASATLPVVFHPYHKGDMRLIDGGILERVPVEQVKKMGADIVVGVDVLGQRQCSKECPNVIKVLTETIDIFDNYRTRQRREECKDIIDFWLEPDLGDMSQYDVTMIRFAYEKGYELGKQNVDALRKALGRF